MPAEKDKLVYGLTCPTALDTWWEFKGYPFGVVFYLNGWGFNGGLAGNLHIGPVGQSPPIRISISDMVFVDLANEDKLVRIDSPSGA